MSYIYNLADTWDNAGTVFTAIKMNVTDVASNASSALLDLQVGGVSQFKVSKAGAVTAVGVAIPTISSTDTLSNKTLSSPTLSGTVAGTPTFSGVIKIDTSTAGDRLVVGPTYNGGVAYNTGNSAFEIAAWTGTPIVRLSRHNVNAWEAKVETTGHLNFTNNGSSRIQLAAVDIPTISSTDTLSNKTLSSPTVSGTIAGAATWSGAQTFGVGGASGTATFLYINGTAAGTGGGSALWLNNNGTIKGGIGSWSAFSGGAYDSDLTLYSPTGTYYCHEAGAKRQIATDVNAMTFTNKTLSSPTLSGTVAGSATFSSTQTFSTRLSVDTLTVGRGGQTAVAGNVAVGTTALNSASLTGSDNTAVGSSALRDLTTGAVNTAVGNGAMIQTTTAANNTAVGGYAMFANTTGAGNSAFGSDTLTSITTANNNSAFGRAALRYFNTSNNTAVGLDAARGSTTVANNTGSSLTAVGHSALIENTTGSSNSAVGVNAGDAITTGSRNTIIGANTDPSAASGNDQTVVGEGLTGKGDDTAFIGGTNGAYNEKNVTTWETTSDARIKKNIVSNGVGLEVINQIDVRNFEYRTAEEITELPASAAINQPGVQLGVIAQELQAVLPQCVTENSTGVLSVSTDPLIWYLINAVKQLSAEVKTLKGA